MWFKNRNWIAIEREMKMNQAISNRVRSISV